MTFTALHEPAAPPGDTSRSPERPHLVIGFVPLTDAAPIILARELGCFERRGLDVTLSREESWAAVRDKLAADVLDAAHLLAAMPLAMTLGLTGIRTPMVTAFQLNYHGNAITLAESIASRLDPAAIDAAPDQPLHASALRPLVDRFLRDGKRLTFGAVFPYSSHNYELRSWLIAGAIDPDRDIQIVIVPPPLMVDRLRDGTLHGFCVGEPWNSLAVERGIGRIVAAKHQLWPGSLEKVLGVTARWAEHHPATHLALLAALHEACQWLDIPENRPASARLLASHSFVRAPESVIAASLCHTSLSGSTPDAASPRSFFEFHCGSVNRPDPRQALRIVEQMTRFSGAGGVGGLRTDGLIERVFRPDLYDQMLALLHTGKAEGVQTTHSHRP